MVRACWLLPLQADAVVGKHTHTSGSFAAMICFATQLREALTAATVSAVTAIAVALKHAADWPAVPAASSPPCRR